MELRTLRSEFLTKANIDALREWAVHAHPTKSTPILVRYVNKVVVLHQYSEVIEQAQTLLEEWLKCMRVKLHPDKTQIVNTIPSRGLCSL
jgi:hypothetical protein